MSVQERPRLWQDALLSLSGVSVAFGSRTVLRDITWQWPRGESVLVVGASGAGKSTLAMLAAGLIPESVEAEVQGQVVRHPGLDAPGAIGYVFQDPDSQFCQIRAGEEIAFGLENKALGASAMDAAIAEALGQSRLEVPLTLEHMVLSGGNKQKLAIACALALKPQMLVLDEPTANLDPASTAQIYTEVSRLVDSGITVMVIEHKFLDLAPIVPWMLLVSNEGTVHRFGPTAELLAEERDWMRQQGLLVPEPQRKTGHPNQAAPRAALQNVSARYHRRSKDVLSDVTLSVGQGELVALVGANGAGKSTLLKVIAGLMKPSGGVVVNGANADAAFGFQNPEHQFIFERVVDELANRRVEGEVPEDVTALLDEFGLVQHAFSSPYALSQGQKRRLSVAVMMQRPHSLYCLDEPTFGQDAATRDTIMAHLQHHLDRGAGVVISTHDLELVERWADRVIVVEQGRIAFDGRWADLVVNHELLVRARLVPDARGDLPVAQVQPVFATFAGRTRESLMGRLNPAWKLASIFGAVGLTAFARRLDQSIWLALVPLVLLGGFSGLALRSVAKRLLPFVVFFALYIWTMTAYAAVGPHTPVIHVLWYRLSYPGFIKGLVLGFRMLAAVGFGLLFVSTIDLVDLVKSLSRNFRVPPKFSYGTLAGLRFFPQFQEEWRKLRLARRVRGRDARWSATRIVTYALPLLSDAVRLSERVAIAMEARGFRGRAADSSRYRTYYHPVASGWRDAVFGVVVIAAACLALWH